MKIITLILILFLFVAFPAQTFLSATSFAQAPRGKSCDALGRPDIIVQPHEVLGNLLPNINKLSLTDSCLTKARDQVEAWKQEDLNNWERLSNQLCSAKAGWVEHNPGTCQAGGPPPICKVDHWYQDSKKSLASFNEMRKAIAEQREQALFSAACDCLRSDLEKQVSDNSPRQDLSNPYNINTNPFVVPCSGSSSYCPIGTSCIDGVCRLPKAVLKATETAADFAAGQAKDEAIGKWLTFFAEVSSSRIPAAIGSVYKKITSPYFQIIEPTMMGTNKDVYTRGLRRIDSQLGSLRGYYSELRNYYQNKPGRSPSAIMVDVRKAKQELRESLEYSNVAFNFIVKKRELSRDTCYNVFEYENQMVNESIVRILSLPEPNK